VREEAIYRKLMKLSRRHWVWVMLGGLSCLLNGCMVPFFSVAFGNILELLSDVGRNEAEIDYYCWYFLLLAVVGSSTAFLYNFSFGMVGDKIVFHMRMKVFEKLLRLPMSYYDRKENTPGIISTKLATEAYQIHNVLTGLIAVICLNSTAVACALAIALVHCWQIGLVSLACSPFLILSSFVHISVVKRINRKSERS
jgi:ATP-binding cassette, subfamily B (MDR/TAP), member 11